MEKSIVDIHAHILPCLDDGPGTVDQALMLARKASEEGVQTVIATPHCCNGVFDFSKKEIFDACRKFQDVFNKHRIPINIRPGAEVRLNHDTVKKFDQGELVTLNDSHRYLLLELPEMFLVDGVVMLLRQLAQRDIIPVIAHPERNRFVLSRGDILERFVKEGALLQITASGLVGDFGRPVMKISEKLCKTGLVSFIASDIHPGRKFRMADAFKRLGRISGGKKTRAMIEEQAGKLLSFASVQYAAERLEQRIGM